MHTPPAARRLAGLVVAAIVLLPLATTSVSGATVGLTQVVTGLNDPVYVTSAPDDSGRLFVVEQGGKIRIVKNGALLPTAFLDISDMLPNPLGSEQGLLGLAFHPSFKTNGLFYVYWTLSNGDDAVNQFKVSSNPDVATRTSSKRVITFAHPYANHNGGMLAFDKTGYLFIGTGDGGGSGDPGNRAQSKNSLLGKILRINVNGVSGTRQYTVPAGNPYVGKTGLDEIWSYGLRNPWRFSFDRLTGDLWIGDVGQDRYEEIDRSTVTGSGRGRGINFGWRVMEGRHCYNPSSGCSTSGKMLPVVEYSHSQGCAVTGGYVYRGKAVPSLFGRYVFADFCSGTIWSVPNGGGSPMAKSLLMDTSYNLSSFGEDSAGELYVVDRNGTIYRFK